MPLSDQKLHFSCFVLYFGCTPNNFFFDKFVEVFLIMNDKTFKKMYLVCESKLSSLKENKIPLEKVICQEGVNIRVKPIKRKNNYQPKKNNDKKKWKMTSKRRLWKEMFVFNRFISTKTETATK